MRIFSEDETLLSTFDSSSVMSQGSPHPNSNATTRDRPSRSTVAVSFLALFKMIGLSFKLLLKREIT